MSESAFIALVNNASLLIALAYAYSLIGVYEKDRSIWLKIVLGFVVGAIGLCIMMLPYETAGGIKFDTRSVLLAGSGLFLGTAPTVIAMILTGLSAWVELGIGATTGLTVILASGLIGILWRGMKRGQLVDVTWGELYRFGLIVHLAILAFFFILLPLEDAVRVLDKTWLPVVIVYPVVTMLFGRIMALRLQRERTARLIRESEERHRSLFADNHSVMLLIDPVDGQIVDANRAAAKFYGLDHDALCTHKIADLTAPPETRTGEEPEPRPGDPLTAKHRARGGQIRDVQIYSDTITIDERTMRYAIVHDITEQKRLEDQLQQAQKMEAVGWLAGGVAHDYNNKLQAVLGFAEMAEKEAIGRPRLRGYLGEIRKAARHSAQLTMQLMAFARQQTLLPEVLNMNGTISHMLKMIKNMLGEDIEVEWKPAHDLWNVLTDASQIDRVLVNLALNARDAMPDVGKITIETRNVAVSKEMANRFNELLPGDYVMISISDTGAGMTNDQLRHIFEPFYSTKGIGRGTGLGLASVYGIIKQNKGFIDVRSKVGEGSTFEVYLPRTHEKPPEQIQDKAPEPNRRGDETVMLVEDEKLVLELIQETLRDAGYTVLAAGDPQGALAMAENYPDRIDLLVTDVVMPGMNGRVLYDTLSAKRSGLKVLYMSGYTANANISRGVLDNKVNYMQKPFSINTIANKVREVLDGAKPHRLSILEEEKE